MVDFLLSHKANVNAASLSSSPLHEAVRTHNKSMVEKILSAGADVNLKTDGGKTPLHLAAQEGLVEIFDLLLSKKADPQAMNDADTNLLHFASTQDSRHIMEKALAARTCFFIPCALASRLVFFPLISKALIPIIATKMGRLPFTLLLRRIIWIPSVFF